MASIGGLAGCGADEDRTALAVRSARWTEQGELVVIVECAKVTEREVRPGAGVEGLPLVTLWDRPRVGGCRTEVTLPVPTGTTRIEDAATGKVVDLPQR
jgi:hypothetical protein